MGIDPASLAIEAAIASAVVGGAGQIYSGYAANNAAKFNAGMSMNNAKIAKENAALAGQFGEAKSEQSQMKTAQQVGGTLARQGASGVDVSSKSSVDTRVSEQAIGALEAMNIRSNAAREAYGFKIKEVSERAQAKQYRAEGHNAITEGYIGATSSILGVADKIAGLGGSKPDNGPGADTYSSYLDSKSLNSGTGSGTGGLY